MTNEIKCQYGASVQWVGDDGGWNIGHIVVDEFGLDVKYDGWRCVQPYHGGCPVFVREDAYTLRDQPHEEPTT